MEMIKLNEVLKVMETGENFAIDFVTFDKRRKTGGIIRQIPEARLCKSKKSLELSTDKPQVKKKPKVNPNHWVNATRSIRIIVDGIESSHIRKIHIFLIVRFNGKKVFL